MRPERRAADELRPVHLEGDYVRHPEGCVLIACGDTRVLCAASLEDKVPPFLKGGGSGWVTAEYGMLPRSTYTRNPREGARGQGAGRTYEIQRLIGRALRSVVDLNALGERSVVVDCDVIQADGGTRTASITGGFLALALAVDKLLRVGILARSPLRDLVAAVSVGVVKGEAVLDLCYEEDWAAEVDMNVAATGEGLFVEVQGTAEHAPFSEGQLQAMLDLARGGIRRLVDIQRAFLSARLDLSVLVPSPR